MVNHHLLLIYPPDRESERFPEVPPLGLGYLASFVRTQMGKDYLISLWDLNLHRISREQFREKLLGLKEKPDIIGIGGIVTVFSHFLWMASVCKEVFPHSLLVAGGSLGSTVPHLLFSHSPVDICVKGEGEFTLVEIIRNLEAGVTACDMHHIPGIFLWNPKEGRLIATPPRPRTPDLDVFGMPAYDLLDVYQYAANGMRDLGAYIKDLPPHVFDPKNLHMAITTARGCTNRCTFCYRQFPKIGMNSPEFVKRHILFLYHQFGITVFTLLDELFNLSEKRVNEMISCFTEIKQQIPGFCFRIGGARVDLITTEWLKRLKEAGCFEIFYGLESGSQRMLNLMKKRTTVEQNRQAVIAARDAGLHCVPQFVIGLPGESKDTLRETVSFVKSIDFWSYISLHKANAYPGSEIYEYAKDKGLIKDEFAYVSSLGGTSHYTLALAELSLSEMNKILRTYALGRQVRLLRRNHSLIVAIFLFATWLTKGAASFAFRRMNAFVSRVKEGYVAVRPGRKQ